MNLKNTFKQFIYSGTHSQLEDSKRLAIQIANFDGLLTLVTLAIYFSISIIKDYRPLLVLYSIGIVLVLLGLGLIRYRKYDSGRIIIHLNGLAQIFISGDYYLPGSGYEYYYFTSLTIPLITFSLEEHWKGIILSAMAAVICFVQMYIGPGLILSPIKAPPEESMAALLIVMIYIIVVFAVFRWQLNKTQQEMKRQSAELIHSSNLMALGEMSGGIAHELNNPLQSLIFQNESLRRLIMDFGENSVAFHKRLESMDATILKISKMIKGLRDLSRDGSEDPPEVVSISEILEDVLSISIERLKKLNIDLKVNGNVEIKVKTQHVQIAQVFLNLINNAVDAIKKHDQKWIRIEVSSKNDWVLIKFIDSGQGIDETIAQKMMKPFFTTKDPSIGTGLGLSISDSIMKKNGGRLTYDSSSLNTTFIVELPLTQEVQK